MEKNCGVACCVQHIFGMVFCESSNADLVMEETSSNLEVDDLQGFHIKEIRKSGILDLVCAVRSFENVNKNNTQEF
jgi:hypothetical protein